MSERVAWGVTLSLGVMTIVSIELGKYGSLSAVCWLAGLCAIACTAIVATELRHETRGADDGWLKIGAAVGLAWTLLVIFELVDVGIGTRLYLNVATFDHSLRTAFVDAVMRTGVPPANPLYWPGHAAPMRYYYFWYVLAAVAAKLGRASAHQALIASVVWAGFGLVAVLGLYARHFLPRTHGEFRPFRSGKTWPKLAFALALLGVTGLDILPVAVKALVGLTTDPDMEWWSSDQITSWFDSLLWVPHHIAGLVCCVFGFLVVWMSKGRSAGQRLACGTIAGLSFASAFGLSTWVPVAFAFVMVAWLIWVVKGQPESRPRAAVLLSAGVIAVLAVAPFLAELRSIPSGTSGLHEQPVMTSPVGSVTSGAAHLLRFRIRRIIDSGEFWGSPKVVSVAQRHPIVGNLLAHLFAPLLLLIPGYITELGFYFLLLIVVRRAKRRSNVSEAAQTLLFLTGAALVIATFIGSTVIASNDFGWRSILIAQFFLLLLAVRWCEGGFGPTSKPMRVAMISMLWIGLAGSVYQVFGLRLYLPVEQKLGRADEVGLADATMVFRRGFDAMDRQIPKDAIVQFNTEQPSEYFRYAQVMQAGRQIASALPDCAAVFGGEVSRCAPSKASVTRLFSQLEKGGEIPGPVLSAPEARVECENLGADYLVATKWDRVWLAPHGWVWNLPAVVDTGNMRVLNCHRP